jgi:hypothetical protein
MKLLLVTATSMWAESWELFTTFLLVRYVLILCHTVEQAPQTRGPLEGSMRPSNNSFSKKKL